MRSLYSLYFPICKRSSWTFPRNAKWEWVKVCKMYWICVMQMNRRWKNKQKMCESNIHCWMRKYWHYGPEKMSWLQIRFLNALINSRLDRMKRRTCISLFWVFRLISLYFKSLYQGKKSLISRNWVIVLTSGDRFRLNLLLARKLIFRLRQFEWNTDYLKCWKWWMGTVWIYLLFNRKVHLMYRAKYRFMHALAFKMHMYTICTFIGIHGCMKMPKNEIFVNEKHCLLQAPAVSFCHVHRLDLYKYIFCANGSLTKLGVAEIQVVNIKFPPSETH